MREPPGIDAAADLTRSWCTADAGAQRRGVDGRRTTGRHQDDPDCLGYVGAPEGTGARVTMGCDQFDLNFSVSPPPSAHELVGCA